MNEQDIAAADAILLMEAEEKVKMRILQVLNDVLHGYEGVSLVGWQYAGAVTHLHSILRANTLYTIKNQL